jgi:hypothetical protein
MFSFIIYAIVKYEVLYYLRIIQSASLATAEVELLGWRPGLVDFGRLSSPSARK